MRERSCGGKLLLSAEVVKWQTRTFEGRVAQAVRVQVPPSAPKYSCSQHIVRSSLRQAQGERSLGLPFVVSLSNHERLHTHYSRVVSANILVPAPL